MLVCTGPQSIMMPTVCLGDFRPLRFIIYSNDSRIVYIRVLDQKVLQLCYFQFTLQR